MQETESTWQYQEDPGMAMPEDGAGASRTSKLAIASLPLSLLSLGGCCIAQPFVAAIAPLVALVATIRVIATPRLRGLPWSISGLVLGVVFALLSVVAAFFVSRMQIGPDTALTAARDGDVAAFRAAFAGEPGTDEEAEAFIAELESRYGAFRSATADEQAMQQGGGFGQPAPGETSIPIPYTIEFENATVDAELELIVIDEIDGELVFMRPGMLRIIDDERGDLVWPPDPDRPAGDGAAEPAGEAGESPAAEPAGEPPADEAAGGGAEEPAGGSASGGAGSGGTP